MKEFNEENLLEKVTDFELVQTEGEKYVIFFLDDEMFAVPIQYVAEVDRLLAVTQLPNVPNWLMGIANLRGDIVSVVDLRSFWERKTISPNKTKTLILRSPDNETLIAFVVDKLGEIATLQQKESEFITQTENPMPHVGKKLRYQETTLYLLDAENLLSSPKLQSI